MRTTLDIDDDVLRAAKDVARVKKVSIGKAMSDIARQSLAAGAAARAAGFASEDDLHKQLRALGVVPFAGGKRVTNAMIDALRDEESI